MKTYSLKEVCSISVAALLLGAVIAVGTAISLVNSDRLMVGKRVVYKMDIVTGGAPINVKCEASRVFGGDHDFVIVHGYGYRNNVGYGGDGLYSYDVNYDGTPYFAEMTTRAESSYHGHTSRTGNPQEGRDIVTACIKQFEKNT